MDSNVIIPIIIGIVGGIAFTNYYFSKKCIVKRKLKKAVGKNISMFQNGDIAKVVGKVEFLGEPLIAPLSLRRCSYYYVLVEKRVSHGKSSSWQDLIEEEVAGKFLIKDGAFYALVNCKNIKTYLVEDREYSSGFLNNATPNLEYFLSKHGYSSENMFGFNKTLQYKEGILEEGEYIAVVGRGEWKLAQDLQLPDSYGKVLVISSFEDQPVYLSDDPVTVKQAYA